MRFVRTAENLFGLPQGFTRVEYLESTGTQYIDTGVIGNGEFDVDYIYYQTQDTANAIFAGTRSSSQHLNFGQRSNGSGGGFSMAYLGEYWQAISSPAINTKIRVQISYKNGSQTGYLNGVAMTGKTLVGTEETNLSIYVFKRHHYSTDNVQGLVGRIYYFKLWKDGTLVRDFIPCIDPLGVACMYDLVGKKPYYNLGTGNFTAGRKIIPVEYIECTGTQYINTLYNPNSNTKVEAKFKMNETPNNFVWLFHARNQTVAGDGYGFGCNGSGYITSDFNNRVSSSTVKLTNGTIYDIVKDKNICKVNDITLTNVNSTFTVNYSLLMFALNDHDSVNASIPKANCYYFRIYDNGVLVRDFIPCKDENNVGYMFDNVSGTCYLNAGSGDFGVGENKYTSKLRLIKGAKELPVGYKRVDYLESTGTQYIDTEYTINTATDEVETYFQLITTDKYKWLMGEHDNGARFGIGSGDGTNLRNVAYGASTYKVNDTEVYNSQHYFNANSNGVYVNGTQVKTFEDFTSTSTIYLFNLNISGGGNGASGKIWYYKHKRNGILIRNFVPCLDKNNVPCMVDLVSGGTYYNQGTGDFTYGHIITPVEYLESTGTQYIDTGIKLNNNSSVEIDYQLTQATQSRTGLFGALNLSGSNQGRFGSLLSPSNQQLEHGYGSGNDYWQQGLPDTNRHTLYQKKNEVYFDGTLIHTFSSATFSLAINAYLGNFVFTNYTPAKAKYYGSKLWDGETLVRSFIPVRDENNVGYMFDEVTGQLFGNAGSGSFVIGNDLQKYKVRFIQDVIPSAYLPLKYLQSTGTQYIDTGFKMSNDNMTFNGNIMWTQSNGIANFFYGYRSVNSAEYRGDMRAFFIYGASPAGRLAIRYGVNADNSTSVAVSLNQKYNISWDGDNLKVNGTTFASLSSAYTPANYQNIYLFWCNCTGYYSADVDKFSGRIYNWQIKQDGVLVRDLYPALRKSDNKPGMYDRITKQFFVNQGTGEFNYG